MLKYSVCILMSSQRYEYDVIISSFTFKTPPIDNSCVRHCIHGTVYFHLTQFFGKTECCRSQNFISVILLKKHSNVAKPDVTPPFYNKYTVCHAMKIDVFLAVFSSEFASKKAFGLLIVYLVQQRAVDEIKYHDFTTFTAAALQLATSELMSSDRFNDSSTEKVILLLTDGR